MVKLSSAASTRSIGQVDGFPIENLIGLFHQPQNRDQFDEALVDELVLRGVLSVLEQDSSKLAVNGIMDAALLCPSDRIRELAIQALARMSVSGNALAGDALFLLAVHHGNQPAVQTIRQNSLQASSPGLRAAFLLLSGQNPEFLRLDPDWKLITSFFFDDASPETKDRLLAAASGAGLKTWAIIASTGQTCSDNALNELHRQFGSFPERERQLAMEVLSRLAKAGCSPAAEAICRLYIDYEYIPARLLAIAQGYLPAAPVQTALFHFLAEQWQIYDYIDFNQSYLAAAYEAAGPNLRKRILFLSRYSGRTEWMKGLSTASRQRWLWDLNDADWELAMRNLASSQHYEDLWRLAQVASPVWSLNILAILAKTGWAPRSQVEIDGYSHLQDLTSQLNDKKPPIGMLHTWPSPSPDITSLTVSRDGSYLAVAGSNSTIHLWGIFKTPSLLPPLIGPVAQTRALVFSPDGNYLAAASGDHAIRTFRLSDGKMIKSLEGHAGLVRSLVVSPDSRTLFSASFDGTVRVWRFPQGPELKKIEPARSELFGLASSPDGQILLTGGTDQQLRIYRWVDGELLWQLGGHTNTITSLVTVPQGQLAATAGRDGSIIVWNYIAGRPIIRLPGEEMITSLAFHPNEQFVLGATTQGNIMIWNISTGRKMESLAAHHHPITGLACTPDGQQLISASVDGSISAWDMQVFTWSRTPIGNNRSQTLAQVEQRIRQAAQKPNERNWLMFIAELIRWRQRFDIELDEGHQVISIGEFDIEL